MIAITTPDQITHFVESAEAIATYSSSAATVAALQTAYDAGHWETFSLPEPEAAPLPPDWTTFRLLLVQSTTFRAWSEALPDTWREDLKSCAILANVAALQSTYTHLASIYPPEPSAAAEWQAIATANHIPVTF